MAQFYFLSVLLNILTGLILVYGKKLSESKAEENDVPADVEIVSSSSEEDLLSEDIPSDSGEGEEENSKKSTVQEKVSEAFSSFDGRSFRLVVGVLCAFVGIMKLLSVFRNDVPVVGDLFPALAGLCGGASLLLDYYSDSSSLELNLPSFVETIFVDSKKYIGIACLISGLLHFVFPQVLFL